MANDVSVQDAVVVFTLKVEYVSGNAVCQWNKWAHIKVKCALCDEIETKAAMSIRGQT